MLDGFPSFVIARARGSQHCTVLIIAIALAVSTAFLVTANAQQPRQIQIRDARKLQAFGGQSTSQMEHGIGAIVIETAPPIVNLFSRADEGIARSDWKFAIDSLQRIVDDKDSGLFPIGDRPSQAGPVLYEPARRVAVRRLAELPPEGLRAYRLLYDGRAKGIYERARVAHDADRLRQVVTRYALTSYGDDAADLLAAWALDEGRPAEAIAVLHELIHSVPNHDIPEESVVAKLAAAYALLGRTEDAKRTLSGFAGSNRVTGTGESGSGLREWLSVERFPLFDDVAVVGEGKSDTHEWPMLGGGPTRVGKMPSLSPKLVERNPWEFQIPGADPDAWREVLVADPHEGLRIPTYQAVAAQHRLFVRTPRGIAALRLGDLSKVWTVGDETRSRGVIPPARDNIDFSAQMFGNEFNEFDDHIHGALGVFGELVLAVEQFEDNTTSSMEQMRRRAGRFRSWFEEAAKSTQLSAYDVESGELRWRIDQKSYRPGSYETLTFRSIPLMADDRLWVPFLRDGDLYVGVIDPVAGSISGEILLGGVTYSGLDANQPLQIAAGDGSLFVLSGRGVLFAIDTYQSRLRWAHQYTHDPLPGSAAIPSMPVVTAGVVVVAPPDNGALSAFDTATGERRWLVEMADQAYVIGADEQHVWLGGSEVKCVRVRDGKVEWRTQFASAPTGRGIVTKDRILTPTLDGLVMIDGASGAVSEIRPVPGTQPPLGNLLSIDGAMYSVDASTVRKFPDLDLVFPLATAQHQKNPEDVIARLELAWIEVFRGQPERADKLLADVDVKNANTNVAAQLSQCRVEALLAIANAGSGGTDETLSRLAVAAGIAETAEDRLRVELARAQQLSAMGRHRDAYDVLWTLGASEQSGAIAPVNDHVYGPARLRLVEALRTISSALPADAKEAVTLEADKRVDSAAQLVKTNHAFKGLRELRVLADLASPGATAQRALLELANWSMQEQQYERAEQLLREAVRLDGDASHTVAALQRLCDIYGDRYWWTAPKPLLGVLDKLEKRFGDRVVSAATTKGSAETTNLTVKEWIQRQWKDARSATSVESAAGAKFVLTDESLWRVEVEENRTIPPMVSFEAESLPSLDDFVFISDRADVVRCLKALSGEEVWRAPLRMTNIGNELEDNPMTRYTPPRTIRATADGQVAVFEGSEALVAVGLATGRRLWAIPHQAVADGDPYRAGGANVQRLQNIQVWGQEEYDITEQPAAMTAGEGLLAYVAGIGRLAVLRISDGTVVWERDLRGERVGSIRIVNEAVVTIDPTQQRIHVFDRDDGKLRKRILLRQPNPEMPAHVAIEGDTICGATSLSETDHLVGYRLTDESQEPVWQIPFDKPAAEVFRLSEDFFGVGLVGGDVRIVEAKTGEVKGNVRVSGAQVVVDGQLIGGTLLAKHNDMKNGRRVSVLSGVDIATGEVVWQRQDLAPTAAGMEALRLFGTSLPVLVETEAQSARYGSGGLVMHVIDVHTGVGIGPSVEVLSPNSRQRATGDIRFKGSAVVVAGDRLLAAYGTDMVSTGN